jgi:hypothetical protein
MLKKKLYGMMILIVGIMLAFSFDGCGDNGSGDNGGNGGGGGTGGLSGTYKYEESDEDMTMTMTAIFNGSNLTMHIKMNVPGFPQFNTDEDMVRCGCSVSNNKVIAIPPVWVNPKYPSYGDIDGGDGGSGDSTIFTIVDVTTLRDTEGQNWIKQ